MNTMKKLLSLLLLVALLASMMAGCGKKTSDGSATTPTTNGNGMNGTYYVTVRSAGGLALSGVDVSVFDSENNAMEFGRTDANGSVHFELPMSGSYYVTLSNVPKGYQVEKSYHFETCQDK